MVELRTRRTDGGWRWEQYGPYERIWEIRGTTYRMGYRSPFIGVITCQIRSFICRIGNGKLTCTQDSLKSQFRMMNSHLFSSLSLSSWTLPSYKNTKLLHPSQSLHAMSMSEHRVQHTPSTAFTEYCTHCVLHTLSTASSQDRLSPAPSQSLISHLLANLVVLNSVYSYNYDLTNE